MPLGTFLLCLAALALACSGDDITGPVPQPRAVDLVVGRSHACRLTDAGTYCWGSGEDGQLGIGGTPALAPPTLLSDVPAFTSLAAGSTHTCGLDGDGLAYCWGSDLNGELGLGVEAAERCGALPCATRPTPVAGGLRFRSLAAGSRFTCGIAESGTTYCWGINDLGQLGTTSDREQCPDGRCSRTPITVAQAPGLETVSAGTFHSCALSGEGKAYCDALGAGPTPLESRSPVKVAGGIRFRSVASARYTSCGLDREGAAHCWGPNGNGEIGREPTGSTVRFNQPAAVEGGYRFAALAGGSGSYCGITSGGGTVCWGRGTEGQLGSGTEDRSTPVAVPGL